MTMTGTEIRTMTRKKNKHEPSREYLTTAEVIELTGLSFRVLDYWLRTGAISLADGTTPGSGVSRRYSPAEVAAIHRLVERYERANEDLEAIRSGRAWDALLGTDEVVA